MSDDRIENSLTNDEPIDADLGALFQAERRNAAAPADAKARGWTKLAAAVGMPTPDAGPGRPVGVAEPVGMPAEAGPGRPVGVAEPVGMPTAGLFRLLGALALGVVLGGGAVIALRPADVVYVDRPVPAVPPTAEQAPSVVGMPTIVRAPEPAASAPPAPSGTASVGPAASNLAAERAVLDEARTALGRGDGQHALDATTRHQREFPKGQLAEEREAIAVQALTKLQRCDEATARGNRFKQRYSNSVLGPVVDAALSVCAARP